MKNYIYATALTMWFIGARLDGVIDWSWQWCLSPIVIVAAIDFVGSLIIGAIQGYIQARNEVVGRRGKGGSKV